MLWTALDRRHPAVADQAPCSPDGVEARLAQAAADVATPRAAAAAAEHAMHLSTAIESCAVLGS